MKRYAHVLFLRPGDRGGAEEEKEFTLALREAGIIRITDEKIEEYYQRDKKDKIGCFMHIVLHNRKEVKEFKRIMFNPGWRSDVEYHITLTPQEKRFGAWISENKKIQKLQKEKEYERTSV